MYYVLQLLLLYVCECKCVSMNEFSSAAVVVLVVVVVMVDGGGCFICMEEDRPAYILGR